MSARMHYGYVSPDGEKEGATYIRKEDDTHQNVTSGRLSTMSKVRRLMVMTLCSRSSG